MNWVKVSLSCASIACVACETTSMTAGIAKERAEIYLGCPREQLIAEREGSGEYFIHGCGKRALYVCKPAGSDIVTCRRY